MSIFIQVPAYRDFELNKTIASAVNNASGLNKLSFGVHNCVLFDGEIEVKKEFPDWVNVRSVTSVAPKNIGVQKARYIANEFYDGEDYYFQIDSHMRFAKNWDTSLIDGINTYRDMGLHKPLITHYPPPYTYENDGTEKYNWSTPFSQGGIWFGENEQQFRDHLIPTQTGKTIHEYCGFIKSVASGMMFTVGEFAKIKPNPKIAFAEEQILTAARAFTHGFDLVMPFSYSVCHLFHSQQPFAKIRRHQVWDDFKFDWAILMEASLRECKKIFSERIVGDGGLGTARTLEDYEEFSGLNFETGEIN